MDMSVRRRRRRQRRTRISARLLFYTNNAAQPKILFVWHSSWEVIEIDLTSDAGRRSTREAKLRRAEDTKCKRCGIVAPSCETGARSGSVQIRCKSKPTARELHMITDRPSLTCTPGKTYFLSGNGDGRMRAKSTGTPRNASIKITKSITMSITRR